MSEVDRGWENIDLLTETLLIEAGCAALPPLLERPA